MVTVGVLGAGQLGRMLGLAGVPLDCKLLFVDPTAGSPASALGEQLVCAYTDPAALERLAECALVTYEFESVPLEAAQALAARVPVYPPPEALRVSQDRLLEKSCFRELGIRTAEFAPVSALPELERALAQVGLPCVLKTRRMGYDGKGQFVLRTPGDCGAAWDAVRHEPSILESFVPFDRELSVLAVRSTTGETAFYPVVENHHAAGILRKTVSPAPQSSDALQRAAERYATLLLDRLGYVGVLALELFQLGGELVANEFAPRVHNSGHFSIEGSHTSQFENHLRAILGLPLGSTAVLAPSVMLNLVGDAPSPERVLAVADTHLHLYGKEPRPARKLGHITVRGSNAEELAARVRTLEALVASTQK